MNRLYHCVCHDSSINLRPRPARVKQVLLSDDGAVVKTDDEDIQHAKTPKEELLNLSQR